MFPYEAHFDDVALVREIEAGLRLPRPNNLPPAAYVLLCECWDIEPDQRPRFSDVLARLPALIADAETRPELRAMAQPFATPAPQPPQESYTHVDSAMQAQFQGLAAPTRDTGV